MGTPTPTPIHRQSPEAVAFATHLVLNTVQFKPLEAERERLKEELRAFGAETYHIIGLLGESMGTVQVTEPEVKTFKAKVLTVDQDKFEKLNTKQKAELLELGVVVWTDTFTRDAKAKVETTLA